MKAPRIDCLLIHIMRNSLLFPGQVDFNIFANYSAIIILELLQNSYATLGYGRSRPSFYLSSSRLLLRIRLVGIRYHGLILSGPGNYPYYFVVIDIKTVNW